MTIDEVFDELRWRLEDVSQQLVKRAQLYALLKAPEISAEFERIGKEVDVARGILPRERVSTSFAAITLTILTDPLELFEGASESLKREVQDILLSAAKQARSVLAP